MDTVVNHDLIGRYAYYEGVKRKDIFGDRPYPIVDASKDGQSVKLSPESLPFFYRSVNTWVATSSVRIVENEIPTFDIDEIFTDAAGGPLEIAKNEIARLEARIAELKAAVAVIESL